MRIALVGSYCAANEWCAASRIPAAPTTNATRNANLIFIVIPLEANLTPRASGGPGRASIGQRAENVRSPLRANRASDSRQPLLRRVARRAAFRDDQADRGHRSTAADRRRTLVRRAQTTSAGGGRHGHVRYDATRTNAVLVHNPLDMWPCAVDRDAVINYPRAATELALPLPRSALRSRRRRRGRGTR